MIRRTVALAFAALHKQVASMGPPPPACGVVCVYIGVCSMKVACSSVTTLRFTPLHVAFTPSCLLHVAAGRQCDTDPDRYGRRRIL